MRLIGGVKKKFTQFAFSKKKSSQNDQSPPPPHKGGRKKEQLFFLLRTITNTAIHGCDKCRDKRNSCRLKYSINSAAFFVENFSKSKSKRNNNYKNNTILRGVRERRICVRMNKSMRYIKQKRINFIFEAIKLCRRTKTK